MTYPVGISSPKQIPTGYVMGKNKIIALKKPEEISADPLTELLRNYTILLQNRLEFVHLPQKNVGNFGNVYVHRQHLRG